jgi:hypothetical protein
MFSLKKSFLIVAFTVAGLALSAASWANLGPKRVPETLVVVSNYKVPRLMAELIQYESRAPYLLLPTNGSTDTRIFFCPAKKNSLEIREAGLNAFVRFLNPKRIVVIGDDQIVSKRHIDMLDRAIPIFCVDGADWVRVAEQLNFMLNLSHLDSNFKRLYETIRNDGRIYRPVSLPAQQAQESNSVPAADMIEAK